MSLLWQLSYQCAFFKKRLINIGEFCVAILILKMEENAMLLAYYSLLFQER